MKKIKLTKTELKKQKDSLKRYDRFLPTLYIKKQQLQRELDKVRIALKKVTDELNKLKTEMASWISLLGEEVGLSELITLKGIETRMENIAGVDIPAFVSSHIEIKKYDLFTYPLWVDSAVEVIAKMISLQAKECVLKEQYRLLEADLTITSQRVNLFEKVKIPETKDAIRHITIFLWDQEGAAVGWARMAKKKIQGVS